MGDSTSLTTSPTAALDGARQLELAQQQWADTLNGMRPAVATSSFGSGYGHFGTKIAGMVSRAHDVRIAHAQRLVEAARAGRALINTVQWSDRVSADDLQPGITPEGRTAL